MNPLNENIYLHFVIYGTPQSNLLRVMQARYKTDFDQLPILDASKICNVGKADFGDWGKAAIIYINQQGQLLELEDACTVKVLATKEVSAISSKQVFQIIKGVFEDLPIDEVKSQLVKNRKVELGDWGKSAIIYMNKLDNEAFTKEFFNSLIFDCKYMAINYI